MTNVIVLGHGGYAQGVKNNLAMLLGDTEGFYYLDFFQNDNLDDFEKKIDEVLKEIEGNQVLFACDLAGGSPFRLAAVKSAESSDYCTVAGLNAAAYTEMVYNLELSANKLAKMAVDVAKDTIKIFPENE
nr:hypothetical protein [uncultured Caproiciproducens sp.]